MAVTCGSERQVTPPHWNKIGKGARIPLAALEDSYVGLELGALLGALLGASVGTRLGDAEGT
jgi:hypothetical protein